MQSPPLQRLPPSRHQFAPEGHVPCPVTHWPRTQIWPEMQLASVQQSDLGMHFLPHFFLPPLHFFFFLPFFFLASVSGAKPECVPKPSATRTAPKRRRLRAEVTWRVNRSNCEGSICFSVQLAASDGPSGAAGEAVSAHLARLAATVEAVAGQVAWPSARRAAPSTRADLANHSAFGRGRTTATFAITAESAAAPIARTATYRSISATAFPKSAGRVLTAANVVASATVQRVAAVDLLAAVGALDIAVIPIALAKEVVALGIADLPRRAAATALTADIAEEIARRHGRR